LTRIVGTDSPNAPLANVNTIAAVSSTGKPRTAFEVTAWTRTMSPTSERRLRVADRLLHEHRHSRGDAFQPAFDVQLVRGGEDDAVGLAPLEQRGQ
jgi:hypothetical protein